MEQFEYFVRSHLLELVGAWILGSFAWKFYWHRQRGITFPPLDSCHVRFHENWASGNSDKNFMSRLGGAKNCLRVTVTNQEVWIRTFFPFNFLTASDLQHRIARDSIASVQLVQGTFGPRVLLDFRLVDGQLRRLSLKLRNPEAFLTALKFEITEIGGTLNRFSL